MTTQNTPRQPWMHDMKALVCAPAQLWCDPDGTMSGNGVHAGAASIAGFYLADTRTSKASRWTPSCGWTNGARCRRTV